MKFIPYVLAILAGLNTAMANGDQTLIEQAKALNLISDMADKTCTAAQSGGSSRQANVNASIDAQLGALVKILGDVKFTLAGDYTDESHTGVLKDQVLEAAKVTNDCKSHVFDKLVELLIPPGSVRSHSSIENSKTYGTTPQEAYLIATHPTKIWVKDVPILNFKYDNGISYLSAGIENKSEIPAKYMFIDLVNEKEGEPIARAKIINVKKSRYYKVSGPYGITIPANSTSYFPIISVQELSALLHAKNDISCLYDTSPEPIDFFEKSNAEANAYNSTPAAVLNYHPITAQVGLRLRVKYQTIFKESVTSYVMIFAHFTERNSKGWIWYPSTKKMGPIQCANA